MYFRAAILLKSIEALVWVSATQDEEDLHYQALKLFAYQQPMERKIIVYMER